MKKLSEFSRMALVLFAVLVLLSACGGSDDEETDGDQTGGDKDIASDGDDADGDDADGDDADGDDADGDDADGDDADGDDADGDDADGDDADGVVVDGDEVDGDVVDGDDADGDVVDGDDVDGDVVDGDVVDGDVVDGDVVDGDVVDGDVDPDMDLEQFNLLNVWHVPQSEEPPSVTMRNPLQPETGSPVYFYVGGYPQTTIWSGQLIWRQGDDRFWNTVELGFDSNSGSNEFWIGDFVVSDNTDEIEYYFKVNGDPASFDTTYVYGGDDSTEKSGLEADALADPYTFIPSVAVDGDEEIEIEVEEEVSYDLLNVWHIPEDEEPPTVSMRTPIDPYADDRVFFFVGGYPKDDNIWAAQLVWKYSGDASWTETEFNFEQNEGDNDYWRTYVDLSGSLESVEYYIKVDGDPVQYDRTYIYGADDASNTTGVEATAVASPYTFTPQEVVDGDVDTEDEPGLINTWHIPENEEIPGVTMRSPLEPYASDTVTFQLGGYPSGSISVAYLYWSSPVKRAWTEVTMNFDSMMGSNDYWTASVDLDGNGNAFEYYFKVETLAESLVTTYVYGDNSNSNTSADSADAQAAPFVFTPLADPDGDIDEEPELEPEIEPEAEAQLDLLNVWHVPQNEEPPSVTMRNPLSPSAGNTVYIYVGGYPENVVWGGELRWRYSSEVDFNSVALGFDSNNGNNAYWNASIELDSAKVMPIFQYYLVVNGDPETYATTYVYGNNTNTFTTEMQEVAEMGAYEFMPAK